ncbi:hypothetical protein AG1IA_06343 [Rhizoctonia solani AG-1 IA]|uniref:Uncharacterized protein n=1 Tax=Thanatephorus cucumeris (strain AG1-IA) TaxID=983506 RepID=L8WTC3_THACA|nr:hypothetical protein AG1IA_06343 [Rhizoctonia solani AG-1 IA]
MPKWLPGRTYKSLYEWTISQPLLQVAGTAGPSVLSYLLQGKGMTAGLTVEEKETRLNELSIGLCKDKCSTGIQNLISEVLRWYWAYFVLIIGVPHVCSQDDL